jgi:hypothetical protein
VSFQVPNSRFQISSKNVIKYYTIQGDIATAKKSDIEIRFRLVYNVNIRKVNMIKNPKLVKEFEKNQIKKAAGNLKRNLKLMDEMYYHARSVHDFTKDDFLVRDIELIAKFTKAVKSV